MRQALMAATLLLWSAAACRQQRHPHPELTVEEPAQLQPSIDASNPADEGQLLDGFHAREPQGWRWSSPEFTVTLGVPDALRGKDARLEFEFVIPEAAAADLAGLTVKAKIDGRELPPWRAPGHGAHTAAFPVPAAALREEGVIVDFALDRFIPARGAESRRLGVIPSKFRLVPAGK